MMTNLPSSDEITRFDGMSEEEQLLQQYFCSRAEVYRKSAALYIKAVQQYMEQCKAISNHGKDNI
jgi:hypothetical protein